MRSRNRALVEGALLADIAVVLLLARVYLPLPGVRTIWRFLAGTPFVLLTRRQGVRSTVMAGFVAYVLLSALVGPTLALPALDTFFAALIVAFGMRWRLPKPLTAFLGGIIYAALDIVLPTIVFVKLFRVPTSLLIGDIRTILNALIRAGSVMLDIVNLGLSLLLGSGKANSHRIPVVALRADAYRLVSLVLDHWVIAALVAALLYAVLNVYGFNLIAEIVMGRLPASIRDSVPA